MLLVASVLAILAAINVAAPLIFSRLIDRLGHRDPVQTIALGFMLYAAMSGAALILDHTVRFLTVVNAETLKYIASTQFFDRIAHKDLRFFVEHNPVEIQSAQNQGAQALNVIVQLALSIVIPGALQLIITLVVLGIQLNTGLALIVLAYGAVFIALTYYANVRTTPEIESATNASQSNARLVGNALSSIDTLRYFNSQSWMSQRFNDGATEILRSWRSFSRKRIRFACGYGVALAVQFGIAFLVLLPRYHAGAISIGDVVLFNALLLQLNRPFEMAGLSIEHMSKCLAQIRPFAQMWSAPAHDDSTATAEVSTEGNGRLEFRNVGFRYDDGRGIAGVSFVAQRGAITFLRGPSGSGKSTIFKLALKALSPLSGEISFNGVNLATIRHGAWYRSIGVVPQDIFLLNESLRSNIVLGRQADETRLREAAAKAAILDRIDALPEGFDTVVGERGLKLSGGERQRIAIARALYGNPSVLLLDEASSALDEATEADIMKAIRDVVSDVTVVAITHRTSVIRSADHIFDLARLAASEERMADEDDALSQASRVG